MNRLSLAGTWELSSEDGRIRTGATVPGDNYSALISAGLIPHPYRGRNELDDLWVGRTGWEFSRKFTVPEELFGMPHILFHCDSIDTCARVLLNGREVTRTRNMFVPVDADVKPFLTRGRNEIRIIIDSAEKEARAEKTRLPWEVPYSAYPIHSPDRNLIRKVQCHGGWDWGPCVMVSGLYGEISLEAFSRARIEYVHAEAVPAEPGVLDAGWNLEIVTELSAPDGGEVELELALFHPGNGPAAGTPLTESRVQAVLAPGPSVIRTTLAVDSPDLWWPAGYGRQPLYGLTVTADGRSVTRRIGFRKLELVSEKDSIGKSMTFRVNGRNIFCKGADWIPSDALPSSQTEEKTRQLLESAVAANMNMLRVWGGGQYESGYFYDLCDFLGILIWQDFMFACALYPATPGFLSLVEAEVVHQIKRLRTHPCLALWCGNNENLGALAWYEVSRKNRDRYLVDYDRLYEGMIGRLADLHDPGRTYWPSSPAPGRNDYSDNWHDDRKGDMHYWAVWHEGKSFDAYYAVQPRFCSEFGYQSFPTLETVKTYADDSQLNLTSPVMEHHQRHARGNALIAETMTRYYRFPDGFENFLYLSQVQQAAAIRTAVEYWRSIRPICMGTIYWQLNDNWPVASWSSIEYGGKWKILHYAARRFFAPIHVLAWEKPLAGGESTLHVWGVNDTPEASEGKLSLRFMDFSGKVLAEETSSVILHPESAIELRRYRAEELAVPRDRCFLVVTFEAENRSIRNHLFLAPPKACELLKADIRFEAAPSPGGATVRLTASAPAFDVFLDAGNFQGTFSDNDFLLLPGEVREITFTPGAGSPGGREVPDFDSAAFSRALKVFDLRSTYA